jgi:hypothetical protein
MQMRKRMSRPQVLGIGLVLGLISVQSVAAQSSSSVQPNEEAITVGQSEYACVVGSNHLPDPNHVEPYTHYIAVGVRLGDDSNANMQPFDCRVTFDGGDVFPATDE